MSSLVLGVFLGGSNLFFRGGRDPGRKSTAMGLGMQAPSMRQLKFNPGSRIGNATRKCLNPSVLIFLIRKNRMTI